MPRCGADEKTCLLIAELTRLVLQPVLILLSAVAVLIFVWGIVEYLWKLRRGENTSEGKMHMLWGLVGLFVIMGTFAILNLIANTVRSLFP